METSKWLLAGAAAGMAAMALRRSAQRQRVLSDAASRDTDEHEPVLGYDGMDQETLLGWMGSADLDDVTLGRIARYEATHLRREPVLEAVADLER